MAETHTSGEIMGQSTLEKLTVHTSKETFIQVLKNLVEGLENGREFEVEVQDQHIYLPPDGEMTIEVDQTERELTLNYTWRY